MRNCGDDGIEYTWWDDCGVGVHVVHAHVVHILIWAACVEDFDCVMGFLLGYTSRARIPSSAGFSVCEPSQRRRCLPRRTVMARTARQITTSRAILVDRCRRRWQRQFRCRIRPTSCSLASYCLPICSNKMAKRILVSIVHLLLYEHSDRYHLLYLNAIPGHHIEEYSTKIASAEPEWTLLNSGSSRLKSVLLWIVIVVDVDDSPSMTILMQQRDHHIYSVNQQPLPCDSVWPQ